MHIPHTLPGRNWGGMERRTLDQVRWLDLHGHDVWLAAPADGEAETLATYQIAIDHAHARLPPPLLGDRP